MRRFWRALIATLLVFFGAAVLPAIAVGGEAGDISRLEVRVVAQRLASDHIEFGLQERRVDGEWGELLLPAQRFFPPDTELESWRTTRPTTVGRQGESAAMALEVRIVARRQIDGRLEFGIRVREPLGEWSDVLLPLQRFIPPEARVGRYLASSPLVLTLDPGTGGQAAEQSVTAGDFGEFRIGDGARSGDSLVAASYDRTCAVRLDGGVACWGRGRTHDYGGVPALEDVVAVTIGDSPAGMMHGCALHEGGTVSCWGAGWGGQLGQGDRRGRLVPATVPGIADAVAIAAGVEHTCAVHADGGVSCWGGASHSQMRQPSPSPRKLAGLSDVVTIAAGRFTTCGVHSDGSVSCWGLGFGSEPTKLRDLDGVASVSIGGDEACAVRTDGEVLCWDFRSPAGSTGATQVAGLDDVVAVSVGRRSACAVHGDGGVSCWGRDNSVGQLGNGTTRPRRSPARVAGISDAAAITVSAKSSEGQAHVCAIHAEGSVSCWGSNGYGQLGDGTYEQRTTPTRAIMAEEAVELALGDTPEQELRPSGAPESPRFTDSGGFTLGGGLRSGDTLVVANVGRTCAVQPDGRLGCWGRVDDDEPPIIAGMREVVAYSHGGGWYSCVLHAGGTVTCWRHYPGVGSRSGLTADAHGIKDAVAIAVGVSHACAAHRDGGVSCWGEGGNGQMGDGSLTSYTTPQRVPGMTGVTTLAAGGDATCAVHDDGGLSCWGWRSAHFSITPSYAFPERIIGLHDVVSAGIGEDQMCAVTAGGSTYCWPFADLDEPVRVQGIADAVAVATGQSNACVLHEDGGVSCWGRNNRSGELGDGSTAPRARPARLHGIADAVAVSLSNRSFDMQYGYYGAHACAMHRDGGLSCWGTNEYGELGDGTSDTRLSPVRVSMSPEALIHAPLPDESRLLRYHLEVFVTEYEEEVPWLREAWDFIREQTSFTYDICAPAETCLESSGRVDVVCENPNGDFACRATRMRLHGQTPEDFGHQLAHVYDKTTALTPNKAWGAVQLYFSNTYPDCYTVMGLGAGSEILADTMTYLFVPDPFLDYFVQVSWMLDRRGDFDRPDCPELSSRPSAEAVQVVRSGLAGLVPDWYSSNITNGTELWEALRRAPNVFILANLADEFGGLCTTDWLTYPLDPARLPPSGSNPFRDGGC